MTWANDRTSWREGFVAALEILAQAAARLPVGTPDPTLSGASAIELYTGGLWLMPDIEVVCAEGRPLMAELFVAGFRWVQHPRRIQRVLRHPGLHMGIDLVERNASRGVADEANALALDIDLRPNGQVGTEPLWLKVAGIEDLIVQQVGGWLRDGAGSGEAAAKLQALVGLAREGVGGPLRVGYLQHRQASETNGEVEFEAVSVEESGAPASQLRRTSLTKMQAVISVWRVRCGLTVVPRDLHSACNEDRAATGVARKRNQRRQRAEGSRESIDNVIALDAGLPMPRD